MRYVGVVALGAVLIAVVGCSRATMAGTYYAEVRVQQGMEESMAPGQSLAEVKVRFDEEPASLVLGADGHFEWQVGSRVESGFWRADRGMLVLRADTSGGVAIQPALQLDRELLIGPDGELIDDSRYGEFNLEEVYTRE